MSTVNQMYFITCKSNTNAQTVNEINRANKNILNEQTFVRKIHTLSKSAMIFFIFQPVAPTLPLDVRFIDYCSLKSPDTSHCFLSS